MSLSGTLTAGGTLSGGMSRSGSVSGGVSAGQPRILVDGVLKGDGAGNISAAVSGHDYASPIIDEAEGGVAHFTDGAAGPVDDLTIDIDPVQDLHGYANPWPAGGGKNLVKIDTANENSKQNCSYTITDSGVTVTASNTYARVGFVYTVTANQAYTVSFKGSATGNYNRLIVCDSVSWSPLNSDHAYTFSLNSTNTAYSRTITPTTTTLFIGCYVTTNASSGTMTITDFQFELGSSATSYAPYSNICPISGWTGANVTRTGKNLYNKTLYPFERYSQYNPNVTRTQPIYLKAGTYTFSCSTGFMNCYVDAFKTYSDASSATNRLEQRTFVDGSSTTVTYSSDVYVRFQQNGTSGTEEDYEKVGNAWQAEIGSTKTAHENGVGSTTSISWNTEAGTVYKGQLDVTTRLLTVTHGIYTFSGNESWTLQSGGYSETKYYSTQYLLQSTAKLPADNSKSVPIMTSIGSFNYSYNQLHAHTDAMCIAADGRIGIEGGLYNSGGDTLKDVQLVYELATHLTYQLTPTEVAPLTALLGENNIWADTGDTKVRFFADTKLYIQQLTQPTEDDMVANANIASGKYFMVGNNLYYSTASIANGAKIIVGTNCNQVTLAAALNAINS